METALNVLMISVNSEQSRGGIATWTRRYLNDCESHGIFCDIVNTEMVGKRQTGKSSNRNLLDEFIRTRRIFGDLKKCLKNANYHAAHLNTSCGTFGLFRDYWITKRIKRRGIPLINHFHCDIPFWISNGISRYFLGKMVGLADVNLVLCESSRVYLEEQFGVLAHKVPNFLDDDLIKLEGKQISENLETAVFVGRVSLEKGAKELFALAEQFPDITFRLVGDVSDIVNSWNKPENITLLGGVSYCKVLEEMDKADIFLFPSHSEGFSLALTEAMARGLPAIATNVGANADMLGQECGIVVQVGDVPSMRRGIDRLRPKQERSRISQNAIAKVKNEYSAGTILEMFKCYYQQ